jgi:hypothetical protein
MIAPTSTMMTITIARAVIPVVSPDTETVVGVGVGVGSVSFATVWAAMAGGVAGAARAVSKACRTPTKKVMVTRKRLRIISVRGMWTGFMFPPSISETCLPAPDEME